jgi:uncharacterized protein (TIGR02646 family)
MKACLKSTPPELLKQYQEENPDATWEHFKNECQDGYKTVQDTLRNDQGNLCCYCEIETKQGFGNGKDDFRVEHFHPKSDKFSKHNWALDWQNMLGCCHGGSERYVAHFDERYISEKVQRHSDVLKSESVWDDEILNPLEIPAFPILFRTNRQDGSLSVLDENCLDAGISIEKANNCLHSKRLNLNSEKLKGLRKKALDAVVLQIGEMLAQGYAIDQAMIWVTESQLRKNSQGHWPAFFTSIRSHLGKNAENYLQAIDYKG